MPNAYGKINDFSARAIRKLSDYAVLTRGRQTECTRLTKINDVWGNSDSEVISESKIQAIFIFPPGEMPLIRLRSGQGTQAQTQASGLYFFDILPCEVYVRWEDQIENGDILYFYFLDENGNKMPMVFKILDQKGSVSSQLIWRKLLAAPITNLDTDIPTNLKERLLSMVTLPPEPLNNHLEVISNHPEEFTPVSPPNSDPLSSVEKNSEPTTPPVDTFTTPVNPPQPPSLEEKYGHLFG